MAVTLGLHTRAYNPSGLWQFNETLNDTSGNSFNMTMEVGTERYTDIYPGTRGLQLIGSRPVYNVAGGVLNITSDITIECLMYLETYPGANAVAIACFANAGETSADNTNYAIQLNATDGTFGWLSESGSGVDATYNLTNGPGLGLSHIAVTRISNVIRFYLNGRAYGSASGTLTSPTAGSSGKLRIGYPDVGFLAPECVMASLKIIASGLTAAQIATEYNTTLGPILGFV